MFDFYNRYKKNKEEREYMNRTVTSLKNIDELKKYLIYSNKSVDEVFYEIIINNSNNIENKLFIEYLIEIGMDINFNTKIDEKFNYNPLIYSIKQNYNEIAKLLIKKGADHNVTDKDGNTLIILSIIAKQEEIIQLLLEKGANVNKTNNVGYSPLFISLNQHTKNITKLLIKKDNNELLLSSIKNGQEELVQLLVENDIDVNKTNNLGEFPLLEAIKNNQNNISKILIQNNANINIEDKDGNTLLFLAIKNGQEELAQLLIENDIDVNKTNNLGEFPLLEAIKNNQNNISKILIQNNANINIEDKDGNTLLFLAIKNGQEELAQLLIENDIDVNKTNNLGEFPLLEAIKNNQNNISKILIQNNANINIEDKDGNTLLFLAIKNGQEELAQLLIENDIDVNKTNNLGEFPLLEAIKNNQNNISKILIQNNANINIEDKDGNTLLFLAIKDNEEKLIKGKPLNNTQKEIVELLINKKVDINKINKYGETALFKAIRCKENELFFLLINNGANKDLIDENGNSLLHLATENGEVEIVQLLINNGADINLTNKDGDTPLLKSIKSKDKLLFKIARKDSVDENGDFLGIITIKENHTQIVEDCIKNIILLLIMKGADINKVDRFRKTLLYYALENNQKEIVKLLLEKGAKNKFIFDYILLKYENNKNKLNQNELNDVRYYIELFLKMNLAINLRNENSVKLLMECMFNCSYKNIFEAIIHNDIKAVHLFIKTGVNIDNIFKNIDNSILIALVKGHLEILQLLINKNIDYNGIVQFLLNKEEVLNQLLSVYLENKNAILENKKIDINDFFLEYVSPITKERTIWIDANYTKYISGIENELKEKDLYRFLKKDSGAYHLIENFRTYEIGKFLKEKKLLENPHYLNAEEEKSLKELIELFLQKYKFIDLNNTQFISLLTEYLFNFSYKNVFEAINKNDLKAVEFFIENNLDIEKIDNNTGLNPYTAAAISGNQELFNLFSKKVKKTLFKKVINEIILLAGFNEKEEIVLKFDSIILTEISAEIIYTTNFLKEFSWKEKKEQISKFLGVENIILENTLTDRKYILKIFDDSNESKLINNLTINGNKVEFLKLDNKTIPHTTHLFFKPIIGVGLNAWEEKKNEIEEILKLPIRIEKFDISHKNYNKFEGISESIIVREDYISTLPNELNLGGKYLYTSEKEKENGILAKFEQVYDYNKWHNSINDIITKLGQTVDIIEGYNNTLILSISTMPTYKDFDNIPMLKTKDIVRKNQLYLGVTDKASNDIKYTCKNEQTNNKISGSILVSGASGSGKTVTINNLIKQYIFDYESLDEIIIFNFKSSADYDWLKDFKKVKIIDGNKSTQTILKNFKLIHLKMMIKYGYNKFEGKGKENFLEDFNSLIIIDEAQTINDKVQNAKGLERMAFEEIESICLDLAAKIRASGDSLLISTQHPNDSSLPGGKALRSNLRHLFCGKGNYIDIANTIGNVYLERNKIITEDMSIGQFLYHDTLTGDFNQVFVRDHIITDEEKNDLINYQETEHNLELLNKFSTLKEIAIRADKIQKEQQSKLEEKGQGYFNNLENMNSYEEVDIFELAKKQIDEEKNNANSSNNLSLTIIEQDKEIITIEDNINWDDLENEDSGIKDHIDWDDIGAEKLNDDTINWNEVINTDDGEEDYQSALEIAKNY